MPAPRQIIDSIMQQVALAFPQAHVEHSVDAGYDADVIAARMHDDARSVALRLFRKPKSTLHVPDSWRTDRAKTEPGNSDYYCAVTCTDASGREVSRIETVAADDAARAFLSAVDSYLVRGIVPPHSGIDPR
jgi:hypothetical protein